MEVNDEDRTELQEQVSKSKQKKTLFCRLLMQKKTRVGCLTESDDTDLQESFRNNWPFRQEKQNLSHDTSIGITREIQPTALDSKANDRVINIQEYLKLDPPRDGNSSSTKLALCCAMTESSISLDHPSNGQYLCKTAKREQNMTTSSENLEREKRADISNKELCKDGAVQSAQKNNLENRHEKRISAVLQLSSSINSESASSGGSSCDSSPPLLQSSFPQSRFRRRLLTQRRSADNLLLSKSCPSPSLRHSSPESSRSAPETSRQKKRSSSHDGMVQSSRNEELEKKDKKSLILYRSTQGPQNAEGNLASHGIIASMDSLARHSLLAAQVLHLIPTTKARERNFLHGRIAANSLLGSLELERTLPQRELRIFVGTWNMNGQAPPHELNDFMLPNDLEHVPDVIAVGTQESFSERFEWEVSIQETIGPSHLLFHSASLGTLHLAIFMRRDLLWFCSVPEEASYSVRPGTAFKTKGAVAICFMLFGTSYLFITAHLTAHLEKVKERIQDVKRIVRSLDLPKQLPIRHKSKDVTQNFDCVFWCGDLNFRLVQPRDEVVQWVSEQNFPLPQPHALQNDQLRNSCIEGAVFREFEEGPITFPPTYKYDPGTQQFDTSSKQRAPAYTDRILFKSKSGSRRESSEGGIGSASHQPALECLKYTSVPSICTSDHKPVWGLYRSSVRPGIDTIPLAAGLFNREVYLEGIKRRAAALDKRKGASTVCSIQ